MDFSSFNMVINPLHDAKIKAGKFHLMHQKSSPTNPFYFRRLRYFWTNAVQASSTEVLYLVQVAYPYN